MGVHICSYFVLVNQGCVSLRKLYFCGKNIFDRPSNYLDEWWVKQLKTEFFYHMLKKIFCVCMHRDWFCFHSKAGKQNINALVCGKIGRLQHCKWL